MAKEKEAEKEKQPEAPKDKQPEVSKDKQPEAPKDKRRSKSPEGEKLGLLTAPHCWACGEDLSFNIENNELSCQECQMPQCECQFLM